MNESDFANLYIERILNEVGELTKIKLMNETRIIYLEKQLIELAGKVETLNAAHEKQGKKVTRLREVDASSGTF